MYSSALSIEIISDVEFSRRLVESRSDKLKQVKSCRKKNNSTRPLNSKIKANAGEKQLNSSVGTKQLNSSVGKTTQLGSRNETTQLASRNETTQLNRKKQLNSSVGTKQLNSALPSTAYNRLQPPTTACNRLHRLHRLYSRIGFFYLLTCSLNQWVRSLVGLFTSAGTGEYFPPLQLTCRNCGGGDRGRVAIYRPFGEFLRA
ncbi:hypothetical protein TNCV_2300611 [Trichonephila clavipes]|nr:hypothetical protein TNCV_2300611 [Trichonephila clavipes]